MKPTAKLQKSAKREKRVQDGFFDGRFRSRWEDHGKIYKRSKMKKYDHDAY